MIEVAWTLPDESRAPLARRHSPVRRSVGAATTVVVTAAVVGTVIVWLPPVFSVTGKVPAPLVSGASGGNMALASVLVKWSWPP